MALTLMVGVGHLNEHSQLQEPRSMASFLIAEVLTGLGQIRCKLHVCLFISRQTERSELTKVRHQELFNEQKRMTNKAYRLEAAPIYFCMTLSKPLALGEQEGSSCELLHGIVATPRC